MDIDLKLRKVIRVLLVISVSFILLHVAGYFFEIHVGHTFGLFIFDPNREQSIPKFYSSVVLLMCSGLLSIIAAAKKGDILHSHLYLLGLAIIFFFFAIAKNSSIHEYLVAPIQTALNMSKFQIYVWLYGIMAVMFPVLYLKFFLSLPRKAKILLAVGGITFMIGAFGFDLVVAYAGRLIDHQSVTYLGLAALEDILEMGGIIIFVYGLLLYMSLELKWVRVKIIEQ